MVRCVLGVAGCCWETVSHGKMNVGMWQVVVGDSGAW